MRVGRGGVEPFFTALGDTHPNNATEKETYGFSLWRIIGNAGSQDSEG